MAVLKLLTAFCVRILERKFFFFSVEFLAKNRPPDALALVQAKNSKFETKETEIPLSSDKIRNTNKRTLRAKNNPKILPFVLKVTQAKKYGSFLLKFLAWLL